MFRDSQNDASLYLYGSAQELPGDDIVMSRDSLDDASLYLYGSAQELPGDDIVTPAGLSSIVDALTEDIGTNYVSSLFLNNF